MFMNSDQGRQRSDLIGGAVSLRPFPPLSPLHSKINSKNIFSDFPVITKHELLIYFQHFLFQ